MSDRLPKPGTGANEEFVWLLVPDTDRSADAKVPVPSRGAEGILARARSQRAQGGRLSGASVSQSSSARSAHAQKDCIGSASSSGR